MWGNNRQCRRRAEQAKSGHAGQGPGWKSTTADRRQRTHPFGKVHTTSVPWGFAGRISTDPPIMPARYFMV